MEFNRDFSEYLRSQLAIRKQKNSKYSLRQFAKFLGMEPSFLSKILRGKKPVSLGQLIKIGKKLGLSVGEIEKYQIALVKAMKPVAQRTTVPKPVFNKLSMDKVSLMAEWYYYAILELFGIEGMTLTEHQTADLLKILPKEAELALTQLEKMRLLVRDKRNELSLAIKNNTIPPMPYSTAQLKKIQKQFFTKAVESIENDELDERDHSGITIAIPESRMPEAKKMIKAFRRRFVASMESAGGPDRIYQMTISLYPLSKKIQSKGVK